jgi:hypothetical protein
VVAASLEVVCPDAFGEVPLSPGFVGFVDVGAAVEGVEVEVDVEVADDGDDGVVVLPGDTEAFGAVAFPGLLELPDFTCPSGESDGDIDGAVDWGGADFVVLNAPM